MAYPLVYFFIYFIFLTALLVHNCSSVWENFSTMVGFGKQSIDPFHLTHIDAKYIEKLAKGHQEIRKKWNIFPGILWILLSSHSSNIIYYTINVFTNLMKQTLKMIQKIDSIMCVKMSIPHFIKTFIFPENNCSLTWQCSVYWDPFCTGSLWVQTENLTCSDQILNHMRAL